MTSVIRGDDNFDTGLGLGVGQTWTDVIGSRAANTNYQNTTGKPICVYIDCGDNATFSPVEASADSVVWVTISGISGGAKFNASFIVPNNWYYRIAGTSTPVRWAELR